MRFRLSCVGAIASIAVLGCGGGGPAPAPTRAQYERLVRANYKRLSPAQTRRLLTYAKAVRVCLARRFSVAEPQASPTRIVIAVPHSPGAAALVRAMVGCAAGPPPGNASLQARGQQVLIYLPRYCILDSKVAETG
jgi:hypothetical protein